MRNLKVVLIDSGSGAINDSTHTVHTSIVRPNQAVWPLSKAINSWWRNGPFDIRFSAEVVPFGLHSLLQAYCISEDRLRGTWRAFRNLGLQSRNIYLNLDKELGQITLGGAGRGHISSPLIPKDSQEVLTLRENLNAYGVESAILRDGKDIQSCVGPLPVRNPELMVFYPEDFVLDLHQYKTKLLKKVYENGGTFLQDTVVSIKRDLSGNVTTLITQKGHRIQTDVVFYAGGWKSNEFLKSWLGINLNTHLNLATGVRFALPGHLVNRSVVCGSMFMAPGHDPHGNEITDVGQMFLVNVKDSCPREKHRTQAVKRFYTYFDYKGDIPWLWNCVGRPITTNGLPFVEKVAPNMVVALGPGMFGVTTGAGLAQRGLELLLDDKSHPDHEFFERQSSWKIISSFLSAKSTTKKSSVNQGTQPPPSKGPRVVQIGKRGAMTSRLHQTLAQTYDFAVYGARDTAAAIQDIKIHPDNIVLIASHGMHAKLPEHYGKDYTSADEAIEKVLVEAPYENLLGMIVISGGISRPTILKLKTLANSRKVRLIHLPSLATSMEVLLSAARCLLPTIENPISIVIEDTFHKAKREIPSAGSLQLLADVEKHLRAARLLILGSESGSLSAITSQYPDATCKVVRTNSEVRRISLQYPELVPVVIRSHRIDAPYRYQHRLTLHEKKVTIAFEQSVSDRSVLVPPVQQAIQRLSSPQVKSSGTDVDLLVPSITFEPKSSFTTAMTSIIKGLQDADAIQSIQIQQAELDQSMRQILTDASGQLIRSEHDPSLPYCLRINAAIDDQLFSISLSRTASSTLPDRT